MYKPDDNMYIRALKRLNHDLFCELADWKLAEDLPGLVVTLRDGRRALITFSIDLDSYSVLIDRGV